MIEAVIAGLAGVRFGGSRPGHPNVAALHKRSIILLRVAMATPPSQGRPWRAVFEYT